MNRDDVIRMAREAWDRDTDPWLTYEQLFLERFAALVAAAEREACAKVCDEMEKRAEGTECCKWPTPADCAAAIRG